jgi:hypothetical protein
MTNQLTGSTFGVCCTHVLSWKILLMSVILNIKDHFRGAIPRLLSVYWFRIWFTAPCLETRFHCATCCLDYVLASMWTQSVLCLVVAHVICSINYFCGNNNLMLLFLAATRSWLRHVTDSAATRPCLSPCERTPSAEFCTDRNFRISPGLAWENLARDQSLSSCKFPVPHLSRTFFYSSSNEPRFIYNLPWLSYHNIFLFMHKCQKFLSELFNDA